jgi:small subunit ribosomal protein S8
MPRVLSGLGVSVVSTSKGVISSRKARTLKLGGEVLCNVW